jgi:hypothetical protein
VLAPTTSVADTGLSAATSYSYTVTAIDNAGNESAQSSPASAVTPACPALTQTYLSDFNTYQVPVLPRPVLRASLIDPVFGTTITRVTDPAMAPAGTSGPSSGLRHEYARFPVLSADNSKVVVQVLGGADGGVYEVRDLVSGALLYKINPVDDPELSWHPTDPTRLFYRYANEIRVFHTDTGQAETLMSFPQYYAIGTNEEGRPSDDWQYYAFLGYHDSSFSAADIVVVDLVAKQVIVTWANAGVPDWVSMSPSGNYVVAMWTNGSGTRLYTRTLSYARTLFSDYAHSDFAFDANGNEVLVYDATSGNQVDELACPNPPNGSPIASARLFDGQKKILLGDCNKADWTPVITGTFLGWNWFTPHFSGVASRQHPGWVLVSTYTDPQNTQHLLAREIFWLKLDGSGQVRRLAHHHSDQGVDANGDKDYWAEPHATSAWDGSTILFASVWGQPFSEYDLYTVTGWWW